MIAQTQSSFVLSLVIPRQISLPLGSVVDREGFFELLWNQFSDHGLQGVHEGTLLSEEAAQAGLETDSWTVDSAEAPRERDWVGGQTEAQIELYFASQEQARLAADQLKKIREIQVGSIVEQEPQDWDAEWKASFLNEGKGVPIPPFWRVVPPWVDSTTLVSEVPETFLRVNPGAGFGTGTHETTQLCLEAIGEYSLLHRKQGKPVPQSGVGPLARQKALDFGSGSGILSIGLALLGAQVEAVEIDPLALDNARENALLNGVQDQIVFSTHLSEGGKYPVIVANILRPVLLEFSHALVSRLSPQGVLILSGLIESDLPSVLERYEGLLGRPVSRVLEKGEWRALVFWV